MISRGYAWINENEEHSDTDCARASALAKKWSSLLTTQEDRHFRRMADVEDGREYDPFEDCECEYCLSQNHDCDDNGVDGACTLCAAQTELTECATRSEWNREQAEKQAERDLEIELVEDKLAAIGARIMRPYEHWNEDERLMQYQETRYDNEY